MIRLIGLFFERYWKQILLVLLITVVTLGIYWLYKLYKNGRS